MRGSVTRGEVSFCIELNTMQGDVQCGEVSFASNMQGDVMRGKGKLGNVTRGVTIAPSFTAKLYSQALQPSFTAKLYS